MSDLFQALDGLWTKRKPSRRPPIYIMHRFLASDPDLAVAARHLQRDIRDDEMKYRVWQGLLPKGRGAPRLSYTAPKKGPEAEELVQVMMAKRAERREVVEETIKLMELMGLDRDLYYYYGVEPPEERAE